MRPLLSSIGRVIFASDAARRVAAMFVRSASPKSFKRISSRSDSINAIIFAMLFLQLTAAAPVVPQTSTLGEHESCGAVTLVRTNLPTAAADRIVQIFAEETELHGSSAPGPLSNRLTALLGGFWDAYFVGSAFSYSVTCTDMVELASEKWNILLCRESVDANATECGEGMARFANGTLAPEPTVLASRPSGGFRLSKYANWVVDDMTAAETERSPVVLSILNSALESGRLHQRKSADWMRLQLEAMWPGTMWNVLIEENPGGHYYYCEEQFNYEALNGARNWNGLSVAVFDRRCDTLERMDAPRQAAS